MKLAERNSKHSLNTLIPLNWDEEKLSVKVIDQRLLPYKLEWLEIGDVETMAVAIKEMVVRGAPLIGISAAYGMALAAKAGFDLCEADKLLRSTRPTAVNLMWALDQVQAVISGSDLNSQEEIFHKILAKAHWIHQDDLDRCQRMGDIGAEYIKEKFPNKKLKVLTHCNAGALATGGYGTALGVIRSLHREGLIEMVYADETRPRQQGSRLTVWELAHDDIPVTMNTDNMAAHLMQEGLIDLVVTGGDRIAANGDTANKIGTLQLAISAKHFNIPFYVAAPKSSFDESLADGKNIPIEERSSDEVEFINAQSCTASEGVKFRNPAFDVTPRTLIEKIFTEEGII